MVRFHDSTVPFSHTDTLSQALSWAVGRDKDAMNGGMIILTNLSGTLQVWQDKQSLGQIYMGAFEDRVSD